MQWENIIKNIINRGLKGEIFALSNNISQIGEKTSVYKPRLIFSCERILLQNKTSNAHLIETFIAVMKS